MEPTSHTDAITISGTSPHPIDLALPGVLQDLYAHARQRREGSPASEISLPEGWSRVSAEELESKGIDAELLHNSKAGFDAGIYRGPNGEIALAFCGTDQAKDWVPNIGQGIGLETKQYEYAIKLAQHAKGIYGSDLILSGHSLGGGLASAAAVVSNIPAVTYNSAGVHNNTFERAELDAAEAKAYAAEGLVRSYNVKNELLTHLQEGSLITSGLMPNAIGHRIELPDPDPVSFGMRLIPGVMLKHRLDLHGIEAVMESMDLKQLRDAEQGKPVAGPESGISSRLFEDAMIRLEPQRERLGLDDNGRFLTAAAGLAANSGGQGMHRIDHVVVNGDRVFSVQGGLNDPAHQRSQIRLDEETESKLPTHMARLQDQQDQLDRVAQQEPQLRQRQQGMA
jgi:hypothetical protein